MKLCGLICALLIASVSWAQGSSVEELVERALKAERELDYDHASDLWIEVISHPHVSEDQRVFANFRAGSVACIRSKMVEARMHFTYVLERFPGYRLPPKTSPKIRNFFELVRQEVKGHMEKSPDHPKPPGPAPAVSGPESMDKASISAQTDPQPSPPAPPPDEAIEASPESSSQPWLLIGGAASAGAGALVAAVGGALGFAAQQAHEAAIESDVQVDRIAHYDDRDELGSLATICFGAGAALLVAGGGLAGAGLLLDEGGAE